MQCTTFEANSIKGQRGYNVQHLKVLQPQEVDLGGHGHGHEV